MKGEIVSKRRLNPKTGDFVEYDEYRIDGKVVTKAVYRKHFPAAKKVGNVYFGSVSTSVWPMKSEALAVHPSQIEEARKSAAARGVPTDFTPSGRPILRTRGHRKAYCKAYGFHDRNAGYGDAQPNIKPIIREYD